MTGIERLRDFARHMKDFSTWPGGQKLLDIADQIEREADVETVRSDAMMAWEWVRAHGGLDYVKAEWCSRVPFDVHEKRRRRLLDHIAECETALGRRNVRVEELGHRVSDLTRENAELRKRAMPEGCEWPRYEDGEPVRFEDELPEFSETIYKTVKTVLFQNNGCIVIENNGGSANRRLILWKNERVKRPAVLASDGEPLEVGQTVWVESDGDGPYVIDRIRDFDGAVDCHYESNVNEHLHIRPDLITHQRPVLDADGVPIKVGDVVWSLTDGRKHEVTGIDSIVKEIRIKDESMELGVWVAACGLTHTKPEVDTWERIEEDARGLDSGVDRELFTHTHEDIVRRCRALAERERGE